MKKKTNWLRFEEDKTYNGKTKRWEIIHAKTDDWLGTVTWYNGWRQYVLRPAPFSETIWAESCLRQIAKFIKEQMEQRKK